MASPTQPVSALTDYENRWATNDTVKKHIIDTHNNTVSPLVYHPDILSPGLEAVPDQNEHKEVVPEEEVPPRNDSYTGSYGPDMPDKYSYLGEDPEAPPQEPKRKRICGIPAGIFWLILALLVILAVALGIGLGVGLGVAHQYVPSTTVQHTFFPCTNSQSQLK